MTHFNIMLCRGDVFILSKECNIVEKSQQNNDRQTSGITSVENANCDSLDIPELKTIYICTWESFKII